MVKSANKWLRQLSTIRRSSAKTCPIRLKLEGLEDRTLMNYNVSLDAAHVLTITKVDPGNSTFSVSLSSGTYHFLDYLGIPFNAATGQNANEVTNHYNEITVANANVSRIVLNLGSGTDSLTLGGFDAPIKPLTATDGGAAGDQVTVSNYFSSGISVPNGDVSLTGFGTINLQSQINLGSGTLTLGTVGTGVSQTTTMPVTAANLLLTGTGTFRLNAANNNVGTLAANINGPLTFKNSGNLTVGTVGAVSGVTTNNHSFAALAGGTLTVSSGINLGTGSLALTAGAVTLQNAAITASAGGLTGTGASPTLTANYASGATMIINGRNAGTVNNTPFQGFANLAGGSGHDLFVFMPNGLLTGSLNAGGGTLDYTALVHAIIQVTGSGAQGVSGTGPGIGGMFTNVRSFLGGGNSNLTLTGNVTNNSTLTLGGQLDTVIDGTITGSGQVINVGHTLSGTGTIHQTLLVQAGTLFPGDNGVGTLTADDLILSPQATFRVQIMSPPAGARAASGTLSSLMNVNHMANVNKSHLDVTSMDMLTPSDQDQILVSKGGETGDFDGLPDQATVTANTQQLAVHYLRGGPSQSIFLALKGTPAELVVAGIGTDGQTHIRLLDFDGKVIQNAAGQNDDFGPFPGFPIPVNVALGDITRDGVKDLVVAAGAGNPDVRVYDGNAIRTGTFDPNNSNASLIAEWFPYALQFNVGSYVAVGDVIGDGYGDVVTGASAGNPDVRVYSGKDIATRTFDGNNPDKSRLAQWFAYGLQFNVGATVAVGDIEHNGYADVVTGASVGNPEVKVYSGQAIARGTFDSNNPDASRVADFFAYGLNYNIGVNVAVGDVNGDGFADLVTGANAGNADVRVYDGKAIANRTFDSNNLDRSTLDEFFAFDQQVHDGISVAFTDYKHSGKPAIVYGATDQPFYRVVPPTSAGYLPDPALLENNVIDFVGGITVAA